MVRSIYGVLNWANKSVSQACMESSAALDTVTITLTLSHYLHSVDLRRMRPQRSRLLQTREDMGETREMDTVPLDDMTRLMPSVRWTPCLLMT